MRTITLEEHFATPAYLDGPGRHIKEQPNIVEQLVDLAAGKIAAMDRAGITMQVLSITAPGVEQLEPTKAVTMAGDINKILAAAVDKYPDRFAGFATLPTPDPQAASRELQTAMKDYGFNVENMTEDETKIIQKYYTQPSKLTKTEENLQTSHSIDEAGRMDEVKKEREEAITDDLQQRKVD
jgi:predicted TIM-barrel fold metal-dependent hydrolase